MLPDAQASSYPGLHNLETISDALIKKGIGVTVARDQEFVKGFGEDSAWQELQVGSSLSHGPCAQSTRRPFLLLINGMYICCVMQMSSSKSEASIEAMPASRSMTPFWRKAWRRSGSLTRRRRRASR